MDDLSRLQPLDLLVALKLSVMPGASIRALSRTLDIPTSTIAVSLNRLRDHRLVQAGERDGQRVSNLALRDCLQHAARWIAPARVGGFELGLLTAHAAPPLAEKLRGDEDPVVMPLAGGPERGRAVPPLHPKAPFAAQRDPKLHALLAVVDALRIIGARDREVAAAELQRLL